MGVGSINKTDLYHLNNIVQNSMMSYAKDLFIEVLRDSFSQDSYYHYVKDAWGFPKTIDLTDVPTDSGLHDDVTTRIFIGNAFPYNVRYYPAILVRSGGFKSVPISMSRNEGVVKYQAISIIDGYGNEKIYTTPSHFALAGAWEGSITIDVIAGDIHARDEITEIICSILTITNFKSMHNAGVIVKPISVGSPTETDDYKDKLYKISINCDVRTEWAQNIPIISVVDAINFCIEFGDLTKSTPIFAPNLEIHTSIDLLDIIKNIT